MGIKAINLISKIKPTLVILGDDPALKFVGPQLEKDQIRTVYLGINDNPRIYFDQEPKYVTGVLERPLIRRSAAFIKKIIPQAKKVLILFDHARTSEIVFKDFFDNQSSVSFSDIKYDVFLLNKFLEWKNLVIKANKEYDAIIIGLYFSLNENNKNVNHEEVLKWSSKNSKKPVFAFWDFAVGKEKSLGGLVITGTSQGKAAAEVAQKLLKNSQLMPNSIYPIYLQEGKFIFSKYELKQKNITLPENISNESIFLE